MNEPKDCRVIVGDRAVIISVSTAEYALAAIRDKAERGDYKMMMADDASFVRAGLRELEKAVTSGETGA